MYLLIIHNLKHGKLRNSLCPKFADGNFQLQSFITGLMSRLTRSTARANETQQAEPTDDDETCSEDEEQECTLSQSLNSTLSLSQQGAIYLSGICILASNSNKFVLQNAPYV